VDEKLHSCHVVWRRDRAPADKPLPFAFGPVSARFVDEGGKQPLVIAGFRVLPAVYDAWVGPLLRTFALARDEVPPTEGNVFRSRPEGNAPRGRWAGL
jgi:hypothetical protein